MGHYSSLGRMVGWTALGCTGGLFIAGGICYSKPKLYRSQVVFEAKEAAGRKVELAPLHAVRAVRAQELDLRWGVPPDEAVARLRAAVRMEAVPEGVVLTATHTNKEDARDMAEETAGYFRGMDAEATLAGKNPVPPAPSEKTAYDLDITVDRLVERAGSAGIRDFRLIPRAAKMGVKAAAELWQDAEFKECWKTYDGITATLDGLPGDGSAPPLAEWIEPPVIALRPFSPDVDSYLKPGLWGGMLLGCLVGARMEAKRKPDADEPSPELEDPEDGFGASSSLPLSDHRTGASRATAGDEW
ncbi:hypothetical protein KBB96_13875 [Luteolibacter ambystomatis]|uniref:Uncharacterized protein n=1 Tax=Luteolibacter ambystomatis TaxID=2824561 RepID=A0A975G5Z5_9BACT|nr:hypothetical protein [Luteolibacter ambystomatis]QUE49954.1 hypothetical protein KBB96_13875 [Luteolibacter ambystomatis]